MSQLGDETKREDLMNTPDGLKCTEPTRQPNACPTLSLDKFIEALEDCNRPVPLSSLQDLLSRLELTSEEFAIFANFDSQSYQRNLVAKNQNYEALLLCFESGQRTAIHDHAGSACGVKVIKGTATETIFEKSEGGWLYATGSADLSTNGVVGSVDMDIHQLSNLQALGKQLVTLHIYSPPLGRVGNYSITDNSVVQVTAGIRNQ